MTGSTDPAPGRVETRRWAGLVLFNRATLWTLALTVALAVLGAVLALQAPAEPLLSAPQGAKLYVAIALLAVAFVVTELQQALVEVRQQAYSFTLAGVPLLLGLLYLPPVILLVVRLAAAVLVFAIQRASPLKFAYNSAAYLLDTALVIVISAALVGGNAKLDLALAAQCYLALALVDVIMSTLVLVVIRINQGPISWGEAAEVLVPAAVFVALNTAMGMTCAVLLEQGKLGDTLLATFVVVIAAVYRAYVVLRARHTSLQVVQDFIRHGESATSVADLSERLLRQIQVLVRASAVVLALDPIGTRPELDAPLRLRVSADDDSVHRLAPDVDRYLIPHLMAAGGSALITDRSANAAERGWLADRGVDDALVVAVQAPTVHGQIVALDRLGDTTRFTADDLALLTTLAGHFAVALQSRQLVERLQYEATHDLLTGLPNRSLLIERMGAALSESATDEAASVLVLDLNRFKDVNDALGHDVGDQLLQVVGDRLQRLPLAGATVARLGGDEFAAFLPPTTEPGRTTTGAAECIRQSLSLPVQLPQGTISTEASIGIAVAVPGQSQMDLLRHADTAMYAAKAAGLAWETYSPSLDKGRAERLELLGDLRLALDGDQLQLYYQPKLDLDLGRVASVEALVRWDHPTRGLLAPDVFIPLAESTGLIDQLTAVVLAKALQQCRLWRDAGHDLSVAVNFSARNVNNMELPELISAALEAAGLPADRLIVEITESAIMGDPERTVPTLNRLAATGVTLSLDDFGTGHSGLAYLHQLPVGEVKIDRSFVMGLLSADGTRTSSAVVQSIIRLGRDLDLRIVAEGVENQEMLERLHELGCHVVQGYHIGRPAPRDRVLETISKAQHVTVNG